MRMNLRHQSRREHAWSDHIEPSCRLRNWQIWAERDGGRTLADIGREFGLSRERLRQICAHHWRLWTSLHALGFEDGCLSEIKETNIA